MVNPTRRDVLSKRVGPNPRLVSVQMSSLCKTLAKILGVLNGEGIIFSASQLLIKLSALKQVIIVLQKVHMRIQ